MRDGKVPAKTLLSRMRASRLEHPDPRLWPISLADSEATEEESANVGARFSREIKPVLVGLAHLADF